MVATLPLFADDAVLLAFENGFTAENRGEGGGRLDLKGPTGGTASAGWVFITGVVASIQCHTDVARAYMQPGAVRVKTNVCSSTTPAPATPLTQEGGGVTKSARTAAANAVSAGLFTS